MVSSLGNIVKVQRQAEGNFVSELVKNTYDKKFVSMIMTMAKQNPNRQYYPSVDLGSFDDIEHGLMFGAPYHIMIDPDINGDVLVDIVRKLERYGAQLNEINRHDNTTKIDYIMEGEKRRLELIQADAADVYKNPDFKGREGLSFVMMKGKGGLRGADEHSNLIEILEHYVALLRDNGLVLSGVEPKAQLKKIGEGMLEYWVRTADNIKIGPHFLYRKEPSY